jgi:hypothetical protein
MPTIDLTDDDLAAESSSRDGHRFESLHVLEVSALIEDRPSFSAKPRLSPLSTRERP